MGDMNVQGECSELFVLCEASGTWFLIVLELEFCLQDANNH